MAKVRFPLPELTADQREQFSNGLVPTSAQALALRSRIILRLAEGHASAEVAKHLRIHIQTVSKWRERFRRHGVDGLLDEPRPGQPRKISDPQIEEVIARTLETEPSDDTRWSTRSMAQATGLNQTAISRIWRAFALQPQHSETFSSRVTDCLSTRCATLSGPTDPPDRALVLYVDEKSQIQALERTAPLLHMRPGQAERRAHDFLSTALPLCSPRWILRPAPSLDKPVAATAAPNSASFSTPSKITFPLIWTCI